MVDVLLVNPPSPDGSVIIRDLNRSGRTSKERIIWPQVNLAYLAAVIDNKFSVEIVDCIAENMNWQEFERYIIEKKPRYLLSHVITSLEKNDMKTFDIAKKAGSFCGIGGG